MALNVKRMLQLVYIKRVLYIVCEIVGRRETLRKNYLKRKKAEKRVEKRRKQASRKYCPNMVNSEQAPGDVFLPLSRLRNNY
jgi:hypothetical protein